jgi:ketosteroid isomerase-like protein
MSPTNRELAERAFATLERRDLDAFLDFVDPAVEFTSLIAEAEGQTFRGHEGVRDWWDRVAGSIGGLDFKMEHPQDIGDLLVAKITVTGRIGGTPVSQAMYQVIQFREGKALAWRFFRTQEEALAMARKAE